MIFLNITEFPLGFFLILSSVIVKASKEKRGVIPLIMRWSKNMQIRYLVLFMGVLSAGMMT